MAARPTCLGGCRASCIRRSPPFGILAADSSWPKCLGGCCQLSSPRDAYVVPGNSSFIFAVFGCCHPSSTPPLGGGGTLYTPSGRSMPAAATLLDAPSGRRWHALHPLWVEHAGGCCDGCGGFSRKHFVTLGNWNASEYLTQQKTRYASEDLTQKRPHTLQLFVSLSVSLYIYIQLKKTFYFFSRYHT